MITLAELMEIAPTVADNPQLERELDAAHNADDRVVMFIDILGFSALTESCRISPRRISAASRPLGISRDQFLLSILEPNRLVDVFTHFHSTLTAAVKLAELQHPLTTIVFSDSAFVATEFLWQAIALGSEIMQSMLRAEVPVRIGIGFGSFVAIRFSSDVLRDGANHTCQFLGTSVVRACETEKCGIKGMRILLHPSASALISEKEHNSGGTVLTEASAQVLRLMGAEMENKTATLFEVDYWGMKSGKAQRAWRGLQTMWAESPQSVHAHYSATANAIDRMRQRRGEPPLNKIRRPNLPRTKK